MNTGAGTLSRSAVIQDQKLCLNCAYRTRRDLNDLVRVGPVGLEPTTCGKRGGHGVLRSSQTAEKAHDRPRWCTGISCGGRQRCRQARKGPHSLSRARLRRRLAEAVGGLPQVVVCSGRSGDRQDAAGAWVRRHVPRVQPAGRDSCSRRLVSRVLAAERPALHECHDLLG